MSYLCGAMRQTSAWVTRSGERLGTIPTLGESYRQVGQIPLGILRRPAQNDGASYSNGALRNLAPM